jgi:hypothetical protein
MADLSSFYGAISSLEQTTKQLDVLVRWDAASFPTGYLQSWMKTRGYVLETRMIVGQMLENTIKSERSYIPGTVERVRMIHVGLGTILKRLEQQITSTRSFL